MWRSILVALAVAAWQALAPPTHAQLVIAAGPDVREHAVSGVPTGNVDLAPTLLKLLGVAVPSSMTGRVIEEAFRNGPAIASLNVERVTQRVKTPDGSYVLSAHVSRAAGKTYLDFTDVRRP